MNETPQSLEFDRQGREKWFGETHESERARYTSLPLSTHGLLLQYDIQRAFGAGAWLSVITIAQAVIEATIRDIGTKDYETKAKKIFAGNAALERIRDLRNEILHPLEPGSPSKVWTVPGGDYHACHASLEADAKVAVQQMFRTIYAHKDT
jgi:hypothetical protein